jgi:hypothetical protein
MKRNEWIYATAAQEAYLRRLIYCYNCGKE